MIHLLIDDVDKKVVPARTIGAWALLRVDDLKAESHQRGTFVIWRT